MLLLLSDNKMFDERPTVKIKIIQKVTGVRVPKSVEKYKIRCALQ